MSRKKPKVHYYLEPIEEDKKPTLDDIKAILRAADDIIYLAGRTMLAKILKGSKDKKVLENNLNKCPSYGYYSSLTINEITRIVDWTIINDYLEIAYGGRLPMIVFSDMGWEFYKPIYASELYNKILNISATSTEELIQQLKHTNREVIRILLRNIGESNNIGFIRFLEKWKETEVKKVRNMINGAINHISKQ